jgi:hypothetical protein
MAASAKFAPRRTLSRHVGAFAALLGTLAVMACVASAGATAAAPDLLWQSPLDGEAGSGAGQLNAPADMATNPTTGHVYVMDRQNLRVSEFDAWGEFVKAWGWGVADGTPELQTCGPKATLPTATCRKGSTGTEPGQFGGKVSDYPLGGIAVDPAGDIYVGDMANARVQKFDPEGNFLLMFGGEVDKGPNHPGNVCIAEGDSCGAGTVGAGDGQFDTPDDAPVFGNHIAVGPAGTLFVADKNGRIQEFEPNGAFKSKVILEGELDSASAHPNTPISLAIDGTGNFYVVAYAETKKIFKFSPTGALLSTIAAGLAGESPLTLDDAGNLYAVAQASGSQGGEVIEFDASGNAIIPAGAGFAASEGPLSPEGFGIGGLATSTVTEAGGTDIYVAGNNPSGGLSFIRSYGPPPDKWAPPNVPPEIRSQFATSVDADGATLRAQINPRFWADTTYYVEYGTGKCSEGGCTTLLPVPPGNQLGAGIVNAPATTTSIILKGLEQGTTYHYRFVAQSGGGGPAHGVGPGEAEGTFITLAASGLPNTNCPNQLFRTAASATLVDCRAYEMVSPVEKNNTDIATLLNLRNNYVFLNQSASEGSALTYTTSQGFGDAQGVPHLSQYLATRTKDGWTNHGITPRQGQSLIGVGRRLEPEFKAFTSDLCSAALQYGVDPVLAPGAIEGVFNLYRRHNCGEDEYEALTTTAPPNLPPAPDKSFLVPDVQGFTADGECTVFRANDQLTPDANPAGKPVVGTNTQIYESCGGELHLVSVLPSGIATTASSNTGTGNQHQDGSLDSTDDQAVSADGSRVYWSTALEGPGQLFVRVNATEEPSPVVGGKCTEEEEEKACTIKVSQAVSNAKARFFGASRDGSRAFFKIDDQSSPLEGNLYEFDLESKKATLVATKVGGVMGVGGEASRIYLLSTGALAGANSQGKAPVAGRQNLYLYEKSEEASSTRFIATLTNDDGNTSPSAEVTPVHVQPYKHTARLTPDGRHVAFMSRASLTGYDNTDVQNGEADAEIFTYDAGPDKLSCVSCNPSGVSPSGRLIKKDVVKVDQTDLPGTWAAALLSPFTTELYGTRVISDDGSRVFFNSYEALLPHDTNGKADVYEWEKPGSGDCSEASSAFSPPNDGCLSLISSGESPNDSEFVDASADGTDVFFATASSLLPQDPGLIDIYDARAGGGYPAPPVPPASCEGEACQGPLAPPNDPTPASSAFEGAGNVKAEKKAKKKAHKKKSAKKHAAKKHKRANNKGRAGR